MLHINRMRSSQITAEAATKENIFSRRE